MTGWRKKDLHLKWKALSNRIISYRNTTRKFTSSHQMCTGYSVTTAQLSWRRIVSTTSHNITKKSWTKQKLLDGAYFITRCFRSIRMLEKRYLKRSARSRRSTSLSRSTLRTKSGENGRECFAVGRDDSLVVHWQKVYEHVQAPRSESANDLALTALRFASGLVRNIASEL